MKKRSNNMVNPKGDKTTLIFIVNGDPTLLGTCSQML
jgi:hypothetical protein